MKLMFWFIMMMFASHTVEAQRLRVAVAANAQFVATTLQQEFKKETGIDAELTVGSSGKLTAQIEQGAPFDVFLSADMKYPQELANKGLTTAKPRVYARGVLVMWSLQKQGVANGLAAVSSKEVNKIAIANPKLAPYGEAAVAALQKQHLYEAAKNKIVYGESIAGVNQYLLSGAVDLAFTAKSVVLDPAMKDKGSWVEIDEKLYQPIEQGVVIIRAPDEANRMAAEKFYQFLFGKKAKAIFAAYGYH